MNQAWTRIARQFERRIVLALLLALSALCLLVQDASGDHCIGNTNAGGTVEPGSPYSCVCTLSVLGIGLASDTVPCQVFTIETPVHVVCEGTSHVSNCVAGATVNVTKKNWDCKCSCSGPSVTIGGITFCAGSPKAKCRETSSEPFGSLPSGTVGPCPSAT